MAEHLLDDADMNALFDQERRGRVPGIVYPGVPDPSLSQNALPGPPVLGPFDRAAMLRGERQVMSRPGIPPPLAPTRTASSLQAMSWTDGSGCRSDGCPTTSFHG